MLTFQDLEKVADSDEKKMKFAFQCVNEHRTSDIYKFNEDARMYFEGENPTLQRLQKIIYDFQGNAHTDNISPNHKIPSRFFTSIVIQAVQYLLGNGIMIDEEIKKQLDKDLDKQVEMIAIDSAIYGVGWGFFNNGRLERLDALRFKALPDEFDGSIKAGVSFYQIDDTKPLTVTLYELDGVTEYIQEIGKEPRISKPKRAYKQVIIRNNIGEEEIVDGENYPTFPIVPLYYINRKSALYGNRGIIDAYDMLVSGMVNNVDEGSIVYWVLNNCNAMSDIDDANFLVHLKKTHVVHADGDQGASVEPRRFEAPYQSSEAAIMRLRQQIFENFMALDTTVISSGNVTATQIKSAYQNLDAKTSLFEYEVISFILKLMEVAGIQTDEKPTFRYDRAINKQEEINMVVSSAQYLDEETVTMMLLEILGKIDIADDVMQRKEYEAKARYALAEQQMNAM